MRQRHATVDMLFIQITPTDWRYVINTNALYGWLNFLAITYLGTKDLD